MKNLMIIFVGVFVSLSLILGGFLGVAEIPNTDDITEPIETMKTPENYIPENVYYLNYREYLFGIPPYDDGSNPEINNIELINGKPFYWTYPTRNKKPAILEYNQQFLGQPYIQLVLNSYTRPNKVVTAEIGIDTDMDKNFELTCTFPPYQTTGSNLDGTI